ncbi:MAG TPA: ThuA domain-containing protein, partial [Gemmatales bacterium]|nr:ThuA domain-containing protein [Gemmatales bacterium]
QFQSHGTGYFRTVQAKVDHPILQGFTSFESWDETYVHTKHHETNRIVLEYRVSGEKKEPWTWVRTHGKGRVFYTAWGHDERTWGHPGFQNLVERGIRWACGNDNLSKVPVYADAPKIIARRTDVKPFEYIPARVPNYPPSKTWGVQAEPLQQMQKPLSPEESLKHYIHPEGLELKLYASEPLIAGKPICMNWDEQGRLWLAETMDYPNEMQPEGKGRDRIVILEDTDGDGKADKRKVFVEGLSIPTSFTFAHGGIIVSQAPHMLYFRNEGDKAGPKQILFTGWGIQDTHAGPSNLQYGLDGWYYGAIGYSGFRGEVNGEALRFGQGFFRFKVENKGKSIECTKLEFVASTNNNPWGLGFSEEGILFGSTANGNPSVCCPIPNRYYEMVKGWSASVLPSISGDVPMHPITDKVRQVDYHGRFTAAAGHALYTARLYPKEYWNRVAFVCEPTGHLVACFELTPDGASFRSRNAWNLLASDDEWASPIMAEVGPDGCVWVLDWYNFIVQHNPTPTGFKTGKGAAYETELRDKKHARVYRLVPKDKPLPANMNLRQASAEQLVDALKNDNFFWRRHAQRLLLEQKYENKQVIHQPPVQAPVTDTELFHAKQRLLKLADAKNQPITQEQIEQYLRDLQNAEYLHHRWVSDALVIAGSQHYTEILPALLKQNLPIAATAETVIRRVAVHVARTASAEEMIRLLPVLADAPPQVFTPVIQAFAANWPNKPIPFNAESKQHFTTLITHAPKEVRSQVIKLGMIWDTEVTGKYAQQMKGELFEQLTASATTDEERATLARDLISLLPSDDSVVEKVVASITPRTSSNAANQLLATLAESKASALSKIVLHRMREFTPATRTEAIKLLLRRSDGIKALLDAMDKNEVPLTELTLEQRQALLAHPDEGIVTQAKALLARGGGLPSADRQKVIDAWLPLTKKIGDA